VKEAVAMKTINKNKKTNGVPPVAQTWQLSDEALIRLLLENGRVLDAKQSVTPKAA